eukprot:37083-Chlamydomonas_euryale.AAC.1
MFRRLRHPRLPHLPPAAPRAPRCCATCPPQTAPSGRHTFQKPRPTATLLLARLLLPELALRLQRLALICLALLHVALLALLLAVLSAPRVLHRGPLSARFLAAVLRAAGGGTGG